MTKTQTWTTDQYGNAICYLTALTLAEHYVTIVRTNATEAAVLTALKTEPQEIRYELDETAVHDFAVHELDTAFMDECVAHVARLLAVGVTLKDFQAALTNPAFAAVMRREDALADAEDAR